jgi:hypothetical protein
MYDSIPPARNVWIRQTIGAQALGAVVRAIGLPDVLPVKGIVTARILYADPAERPLADVDVRVPPERLPDVLAFARAGGHDVITHAPAYRNVVLDVGGVQVDVETTVGPPGLTDLSVRAMLARARIDEGLFGFPVLLPEISDHAVVLAVNLFKDKLHAAQPWSVSDLVRLAATPAFDPEAVAARAREARCAAIVWIVADWLAGESEGLRRVRAAFGPRPPRPVYARLFRTAAKHAPYALATRLLARAGADDPRLQARALTTSLAYLARR